MMKKILLIGLLALLVLMMCACGGNDTDTPEGSADSSEEASLDSMPEFTTYDLDGNEVTNDIFAQADITIVNFWGTYCGPCINEMPDLAKWSDELPDNVQLIGIAIDVGGTDTSEFKLARQIVDEAGVTYPNLIVTEDFSNILGTLVGVPTTIFVDSKGNRIGEVILGADMARYRRELENLQ